MSHLTLHNTPRPYTFPYLTQFSFVGLRCGAVTSVICLPDLLKCGGSRGAGPSFTIPRRRSPGSKTQTQAQNSCYPRQCFKSTLNRLSFSSTMSLAPTLDAVAVSTLNPDWIEVNSSSRMAGNCRSWKKSLDFVQRLI